jgi:hypothetical protein
MTIDQRAAQVWQILVIAAHNQQIVSYTMLEKETGVPPQGFANILDKIERYCDDKGFPHLTGVVVSQATGIPGHLYPGYEPGEKDPELMDQPGPHALRVIKDQSRAFVFDWTKHVPPSEHDFAKF